MLQCVIVVLITVFSVKSFSSRCYDLLIDRIDKLIEEARDDEEFIQSCERTIRNSIEPLDWTKMPFEQQRELQIKLEMLSQMCKVDICPIVPNMGRKIRFEQARYFIECKLHNDSDHLLDSPLERLGLGLEKSIKLSKGSFVKKFEATLGSKYQTVALLLLREHTTLVVVNPSINRYVFFDPNDGFYLTETLRDLAIVISFCMKDYGLNLQSDCSDEVANELVKKSFRVPLAQVIFPSGHDLLDGICHSMCAVFAQRFIDNPTIDITRENFGFGDYDPLLLGYQFLKVRRYELAKEAFRLELRASHQAGSTVPDWAEADAENPDLERVREWITKNIDVQKKTRFYRALLGLAVAHISATGDFEDEKDDENLENQESDRNYGLLFRRVYDKSAQMYLIALLSLHCSDRLNIHSSR